MNALIEKLKTNTTPFGLCTPEEQECFKKVGPENCLVYDGHSSWIQLMEETNPWVLTSTIRIRPDYKPPAKWVNRMFASTGDTPIGPNNNVVGVTAHCECGNVFCDNVSHCAPEMKDKQILSELRVLIAKYESNKREVTHEHPNRKTKE